MLNAVFLFLGGGSIALSYLLNDQGASRSTTVTDIEQGEIEKSEEETLELDWDDAGQVDVVSVELGYGLIPLIEEESWARPSPTKSKRYKKENVG